MTQPKMVTFEFTLDNLIGVKAPEGTNPDTLLDAAREELRGLLDEYSDYLTFYGTWDDEDDG